MPGIYSVFIINKSGGLIFNKVTRRGSRGPASSAFRCRSLPHWLPRPGRRAVGWPRAGLPAAQQPEPERHAAPSQHMVRNFLMSRFVRSMSGNDSLTGQQTSVSCVLRDFGEMPQQERWTVRPCVCKLIALQSAAYRSACTHASTSPR